MNTGIIEDRLKRYHTDSPETERRIGEMDWKRAKDDVAPFISPQEQGLLSKWSVDFFLSALERLP